MHKICVATLSVTNQQLIINSAFINDNHSAVNYGGMAMVYYSDYIDERYINWKFVAIGTEKPDVFLHIQDLLQ